MASIAATTAARSWSVNATGSCARSPWRLTWPLLAHCRVGRVPPTGSVGRWRAARWAWAAREKSDDVVRHRARPPAAPRGGLLPSPPHSSCRRTGRPRRVDGQPQRRAGPDRVGLAPRRLLGGGRPSRPGAGRAAPWRPRGVHVHRRRRRHRRGGRMPLPVAARHQLIRYGVAAQDADRLGSGAAAVELWLRLRLVTAGVDEQMVRAVRAWLAAEGRVRRVVSYAL